ncbi:MAG: DHH family phosphoesterase [Oscillospiraceae bacterium]
MTRAEFCAFVRGHDNFVILTHRRPDGDTIGCASALCLGLRQLGKSAAVLRNEQFTPRFAALLEGLVCEDAPADACVISTDIASEGLLSFDAVRLELTPVCAVDHHGSNSLACPKLVEADKAACGEIVHALLTELGVTVTKRIAECLYTAISTDTGCFKFSNTSANTHRTAAALIDAGADVYPINKVFFDTKSFARLRLEAKLTDTMEFYAGGEVGVCTMPKKLLAAFTVTEDDLDSISGFARSIEGVKIGVMIREVEDGLGKISLRTEAPYDASAICQRLGGGGHAAAAGASVPGGIAGAKAAILRALAESGVRL